jgi:type I restriction enzyme S subunit
MINDWKILTLGEIAEIKRGLPSQDLNYVESELDGVRLIRINDFKSDSPKFIKETEKTKKLTIRKGDVLIAGTGATAGISFLADDLWDGLPFSYNAPRIRVKKGNSSKFVYFILNSEKIKKQQNKLFTGNAQPFLDTRAIASFNIPVPPLPEQQKIAEILSTVDDKIEIIDQQIIQTQELKKGLTQRLLTEGIGHSEFKDSPLGMIPKSWEVVKLGEIVSKVGSGKTPSGGRETYLSEGIIFIRSQNVLRGKLKLDDVAFISESQHQKMANSKWQSNDVLLNITGASIGRSCVIPKEFEEGNVNQHVCIIRAKKQLHPNILSQLLNSSFGINQINKFQAGGNREGLNFQQIRSFDIPLAPFEEQQKIADILSSVDDKLEVLGEKKIHYQELKQGLMQQLLTGKIRVKV